MESGTWQSGLLSIGVSLVINVPPMLLWLVWQYRAWASLPESTRSSLRHHLSLAFLQTKLYYYSEFFQTVVALVGCLTFVLSTYVTADFWNDIDFAVTTFFLVDFVLLLAIADNKRRYFTNPFALLDLLVICVTSVYLGLRIHYGSDAVLLNLLRIVMSLRVLRFQRLLKWFRAGFPREMARLVFMITSNLFIFASLVWAFENMGDPGRWDVRQSMEWHESFYFMVITFATVGYGDLSPRTVLGRYTIAVMVVVALISLPLYAHTITEASRITPSNKVYRRGQELDNHVVLLGDLTYRSLQAFLVEFFHPDHGAHDRTVVVLCEADVRPEVAELLRDPTWEQRVVYLQGSGMREHDLQRASVLSAAAVFVATRKDTVDAADADGEAVLRVLSVRSLAPHVPMFVQLRRASAAFYLQEQVEHIMALDRIKYAALAQACLCPGLVALLSNLIRTQSSDAALKEPWQTEYARGMEFEVYRVPFSRDFSGRTFSQAAQLIFRQLRLPLVAVETFSLNESTSTLLVNPGSSYLIVDGDMALVFATSRGAALAVSTCVLEADQDTVRAGPLRSGFSTVQARPGRMLVDSVELDDLKVARSAQLAVSIATRPLFVDSADSVDPALQPTLPPPPLPIGAARPPARLGLGLDSRTASVGGQGPVGPTAALPAASALPPPAQTQTPPPSLTVGLAEAGSSTLAGVLRPEPPAVLSPTGPAPALIRRTSKESDLFGSPLSPMLRETGSAPRLLGGAQSPVGARPLTPLPDMGSALDMYGDPHGLQKAEERLARVRALVLELYQGDPALLLADVSALMLSQASHPLHKVSSAGAIMGGDRRLSNPVYASEATRSHPFRPTGPMVRAYHILAVPRPAADVLLERYTGSGHVVVCGMPQALLHFLLPLRARSNARQPAVVILSPYPPSPEQLSELTRFPDVYCVRGLPRIRDDLLAAGVQLARTVIVLAQPTDRSTDEVLGDRETLLTSLLVKSVNATASCITELFKPRNLRFLAPFSSSSSSAPDALTSHEYAPYFAGGFVWDTSILDAFLVQVFYNPMLLRVLDQLLPSTNFETGTANVGIQQVPVPSMFVGRTYGELYASLVRTKDVVCIALLRMHPHQYVVTAPDADTKLHRTDRVFVLLPAELSALHQQDLGSSGRKL